MSEVLTNFIETVTCTNTAIKIIATDAVKKAPTTKDLERHGTKETDQRKGQRGRSRPILFGQNPLIDLASRQQSGEVKHHAGS